MVVVVHFPEAVGRTLGGADGLLDLGRQDVLTGTEGRLKSERPIELAGCPGIEMEVLPPKGAIVRSRVYAAPNVLYQISVHVPMIRIESHDVRKFFDSFTLTNRPGSAEPGSM